MRVLVAGAGFLGLPLARRLAAAGHGVAALTFSPDSARGLQESEPFPAAAADLGDLASLRPALAGFATEFDAVVHCASSGRGGPGAYRHVYLEGCRHLLHLLPRARLVFTSSTSVYAQCGGETVDESSPAQPDRETGRILRLAEDLVLQGGGSVARVAGIYGPGRSHILAKFLAGAAVIEGDGGRFVNQIHLHDLVETLLLLLTLPEQRLAPPRIWNVADSRPQSQRDLYSWLAAHFQRPVPPRAAPDLDRKRGWTHKAVSNARLRSLGWQPRYPDFQSAVLHDPDLVPSILASLSTP